MAVTKERVCSATAVVQWRSQSIVHICYQVHTSAAAVEESYEIVGSTLARLGLTLVERGPLVEEPFRVALGAQSTYHRENTLSTGREEVVNAHTNVFLKSISFI